MSEFDAAAKRLVVLSKQRQAEEIDETGQTSIINEVVERETDEAKREIGFNARMLVQATLPHSKPPSKLIEFERSNGHVTIRITGRKQFGLPYGTYPRLLLAWVTTEAVRTKSPELMLGASLYDFMSKIGLAPGGGPRGSYPRLRQHMQRLFTSIVSATVGHNGELHDIGFRPVEKFSLFWDHKRPSQGTLWNSTLRLTQLFFEEITRKAVPIDMGTLRELAKQRSPMSLDIYQWLTFRMSYVRNPIPIPWSVLQLQFGCNYGSTRDFKRAFLSRLKQVLKFYPQANIGVERGCLRLFPSKTHIPMRLVKNRL